MAYAPDALGGIDVDRFAVKKNQGWLWIPIEDITDDTGLVPTEAEVNLGQDLTCAIEGLNGFSGSPRFAELQDLCSDVDGKVPDGVSLDDSSISFYLAKSAVDALSFFTRGDEGVIYHCPYGNFQDGTAAEKPAWAWKSVVSFVSPTVATAGGAMGNVAYGVVALREVTLPAEA
jgi:hypothetical protein